MLREKLQHITKAKREPNVRALCGSVNVSDSVPEPSSFVVAVKVAVKVPDEVPNEVALATSTESAGSSNTSPSEPTGPKSHDTQANRVAHEIADWVDKGHCVHDADRFGDATRGVVARGADFP